MQALAFLLFLNTAYAIDQLNYQTISKKYSNYVYKVNTNRLPNKGKEISDSQTRLFKKYIKDINVENEKLKNKLEEKLNNQTAEDRCFAAILKDREIPLCLDILKKIESYKSVAVNASKKIAQTNQIADIDLWKNTISITSSLQIESLQKTIQCKTRLSDKGFLDKNFKTAFEKYLTKKISTIYSEHFFQPLSASIFLEKFDTELPKIISKWLYSQNEISPLKLDFQELFSQVHILIGSLFNEKQKDYSKRTDFKLKTSNIAKFFFSDNSDPCLAENKSSDIKTFIELQMFFVLNFPDDVGNSNKLNINIQNIEKMNVKHILQNIYALNEVNKDFSFNEKDSSKTKNTKYLLLNLEILLRSYEDKKVFEKNEYTAALTMNCITYIKKIIPNIELMDIKEKNELITWISSKKNYRIQRFLLESLNGYNFNFQNKCPLW